MRGGHGSPGAGGDNVSTGTGSTAAVSEVGGDNDSRSEDLVDRHALVALDRRIDSMETVRTSDSIALTYVGSVTGNNCNMTCSAFPEDDASFIDEEGPSSPYSSMKDNGDLAIPKGSASLPDGLHTVDKQAQAQQNDDNSYSYISALTADEIADPVGFTIICLVMFIGDMARGVMFPTLWPLVQYLGGDERTQGFAVASFSFGRILVSPLFGSWSNAYGYRRTLLCSCSILLLGTLLYAQTEKVGRCEFLILCQTTIGIGSGTLGVTRAFVADVTPTRNRTTYMAWLTAMQYAGFTVTPFIGSIFVKIFGEDNAGAVHFGPFTLDGFTAPSYFMSLMCILVLSLLAFVFTDRQRCAAKKGKRSKKRMEAEELANQPLICGLTVYNAAILGCMLLNVSTKGTIGSFETLGVAMAEDLFGLPKSFAGFVVGTCGIIGCAALLSMGWLSRILSDVHMIGGGMIVMVLAIVFLVVLQEQENNPSYIYVTSLFFMYGVGYPIGHTAVIGLFSKIVGRRPQGTLLGWFASAGSMARMFFPIMSGFIAHMHGFEALFIVLSIILSISTVFVLISNRTLRILSA